MSTEENKAVSNRIAEAIGAHDFAVLDELIAPEMAAGFKQQLEEVYRVFPDYHGVNELQIAEGDHVANRFRYRGTHRGEWMGIPPTGREVVFEGMTIDEYRDGRLVSAFLGMDLEPIMEQLGARLRAEVAAPANA